jgi:hypothetical protein
VAFPAAAVAGEGSLRRRGGLRAAAELWWVSRYVGETWPVHPLLSRIGWCPPSVDRRSRRICRSLRADGAASVVVPKSAIPWIIPGADFGTTNHIRKQCFASVLIDSEVRKAADPGMANFRIGTLDHFQPDCAGRKWSISLFDRMIHAPGTFRPARSCSKSRWARMVGRDCFAAAPLAMPVRRRRARWTLGTLGYIRRAISSAGGRFASRVRPMWR